MFRLLRLVGVSTGKLIAFWLTPAEEARQYFERLIDRLAQRYGAPRFEPHVTLCGGELTEERAGDILRELGFHNAVDLEVREVGFSAEYTKTLFVQFHSNAEIAALSAEVQGAIGTNYDFDPHLSLLYQHMSAAEKAEVARAVALPFERVRFETMKAIVTPWPMRGRAEVEAWKTIETRRLDTP